MFQIRQNYLHRTLLNFFILYMSIQNHTVTHMIKQIHEKQSVTYSLRLPVHRQLKYQNVKNLQGNKIVPQNKSYTQPHFVCIINPHVSSLMCFYEYSKEEEKQWKLRETVSQGKGGEDHPRVFIGTRVIPFQDTRFLACQQLTDLVYHKQTN